LAKDTVKDASGVNLDIKSHISRVGRSSQQKMVRALNKKEIVALTAVVKADYPKLYLPMMLSLHTGMRRGEVWGLTYDDVDILNDTITIQRSYTGPTKSGKSRVIPISSALEKILLAETVIKTYNYNRRAARAETLVPYTFDPNPILRKAAAQAGLREPTKLHFHSLRHSFATLALESGVSPRLVSQTLGHAAVSTTLDIYWSSTGEKINLDFLPDE
jgi:integrase